jgi:hypothetical protein
VKAFPVLSLRLNTVGKPPRDVVIATTKVMEDHRCWEIIAVSVYVKMCCTLRSIPGGGFSYLPAPQEQCLQIEIMKAKYVHQKASWLVDETVPPGKCMLTSRRTSRLVLGRGSKLSGMRLVSTIKWSTSKRATVQLRFL